MTSHPSVRLGRTFSLADARLIAAPTFRDERGALGVVQASEIPFAIERLYWLYDVPADRHRGDHGHRSLQQVLIAMAGGFSVVLHDGFESRTWRLEDRTMGLYIPPMMWRRLERFSPDGVCLVLASEAYDPADYYPDFDLFVEAARAARRAGEGG